jgi:hypothetical protein
VAFADQQEVFSRAGSDHFGDEPIEKLAGGGTIGNSALGSYTDYMVFQDGIEFKYAGESTKEGHKAFRFDFHVPVEKSHFLVRHAGKEGIAGYKGSLWVDAETLDPVRIDRKVDAIPSRLGVRLIEEIMHYQELPIGKSTFALPDHSELSATDDAGNNVLNRIKLSGCREYASDSVVKYGSPTQGSAARDGHKE